MKTNLLVSVSGGRTSMMMAAYLKEHHAADYNFLFIMANTGREHEDTVRYARAGDRHFGLGLVYVEATVHHGRRVSSTCSVVGENALAMAGEPFEEVIKKYGVPNIAFPHCTRELKLNPMTTYAELLWGPNYESAIGIRIDEKRRVSKGATKSRIIYPLIDMHPDQPTKEDVLEWGAQFDWDLRIPEELGNCVTCFKKSEAKLNRVWRTTPEAFEWSDRMEQQYGHIKPVKDDTPGPRVFYRGNRSTQDIIKFFQHVDADTSKRYDTMASGGCSESCEVYPTEDVAD